MCSILLLLGLLLYAWQQRNLYLGTLLTPSLFFFSLAFELRDSTLSADYFDYETVNSYELYVFFGLLQIGITIIALNRRIWGRVDDFYALSRLPAIPQLLTTRLYYALASVASIAFAVNFSNVNFSVALLFLNPRGYEEIFGQSSLINYIYFLNIPALCLSIYLRRQDLKPTYANTVDTVLVLMSAFHGIKFTVFDTLLLPALFYFHCSGNPKRAMRFLGLTLLVLLAFYLAFSLGVRGVSDDGTSMLGAFLNYILPNYYNFAYAIQQQPIQFDPLSFLLPDKVPNPFSEILWSGDYGFLLNDRFNMSTAYSVIYGALPPLSWLFFIPVLVRLRQQVVCVKQRRQTLQWIFLAAYIDFCLFFFWYFYAFNKTKYVYYVIVMAILGSIIHGARAQRLRKNSRLGHP